MPAVPIDHVRPTSPVPPSKPARKKRRKSSRDEDRESRRESQREAERKPARPGSEEDAKGIDDRDNDDDAPLIDEYA